MASQPEFPKNRNVKNRKRILLLGGTGPARRLALELASRLEAGRCEVEIFYSLAGTTASPLLPKHACIRGHYGGFGDCVFRDREADCDLKGLPAFVRMKNFSCIIDGTHPFATIIKSEIAAVKTCPIFGLLRRKWQASPGDRWREFASVDAVKQYLADRSASERFTGERFTGERFTGERFRGLSIKRIFLAIGSRQASSFLQPNARIASVYDDYRFLLRVIDTPVKLEQEEGARSVSGLKECRSKECRSKEGGSYYILQGRPPFTLEEEVTLLKQYRIDCLVARNAGGEESFTKIEAARYLKLPVLLIKPPELPGCITYLEIPRLIEAVLCCIGKETGDRGRGYRDRG